MSIDRNDGYAKVINALTAAVITFKDKDSDLYEKSKDALLAVLPDVSPQEESEAFEPSPHDAVPLLPWMPKLDLVGSPDEGGSWMVLVDHVDIGMRYATHEQASIAYFAVDAAIQRMRQYSRAAAESFYREQVAR